MIKKTKLFLFLLLWTTFKIFIELATILLPFYVSVFWLEACGILPPRPGIEPASSALGGRNLLLWEVKS